MENKIDVISKNLKEKFNCLAIIDFEYLDKNYVKAFKNSQSGIEYKYFEILEENNLKEVTDKELLEYFRSQYEENSDSEY